MLNDWLKMNQSILYTLKSTAVLWCYLLFVSITCFWSYFTFFLISILTNKYNDTNNNIHTTPTYTYYSYNHNYFREALNFDVFSAGLIFCQLLFNLLDERTDAAFRQQLQESNFNLDLWLERELQSSIRPVSVYIHMFFLCLCLDQTNHLLLILAHVKLHITTCLFLTFCIYVPLSLSPLLHF